MLPPPLPPRPRSPLVSAAVGIWTGMNFIRKLVLNFIFFGLLLLLLIAIAAGQRGARRTVRKMTSGKRRN